jgi:hypothetical protein
MYQIPAMPFHSIDSIPDPILLFPQMIWCLKRNLEAKLGKVLLFMAVNAFNRIVIADH